MHYYLMEVSIMDEKMNLEYIEEIRECFNEVPEEFRAAVTKSIAHDISIMAYTLRAVVDGKVPAAKG